MMGSSSTASNVSPDREVALDTADCNLTVSGVPEGIDSGVCTIACDGDKPVFDPPRSNGSLESSPPLKGESAFFPGRSVRCAQPTASNAHSTSVKARTVQIGDVTAGFAPGTFMR